MILTFTVQGKPIGKARPRFNSHTRGAYTPKATGSYEDFVRWCFWEKHNGKMLTGEINAAIFAYYPIPKSWTKKQKAQAASGELKPTVKPDCDNTIKAILDALNGVAYKDDSAVTDLVFYKRYTTGDPYVEVTLTGNA